MASSSISKPLSSAWLGGPSCPASPAERSVAAWCWRSEAFAEDLLGDVPPDKEGADAVGQWPVALLCVMPLALALAGGVMAYLTV